MARPPRWLVVTPVLGVLALGAAGAWFYLAQRQYLQHVASANLLAMAQAKLDQIVAWRTERLGNAAAIQEDPLFVRAVERWLAGRQPEIAAEILTRLRSGKVHSSYEDVRLVDRGGRVVLATSERLGALDPEEAGALRDAFRNRRPTISDVRVSSDDTLPCLSVVAPLFASSARSAEPIGAVVHVVDARRSLFRLAASWPSPSPSAEANLVRRDGDSVLFLTPRRFHSGAAPPPRIALNRRDVPAVMAVLGTEGVGRGVDYRGVRVISALRAVPGTPWFLVVKVDEAEALAVWRTRVALVFAVLLGLGLVAGATAIAVGRRSAAAHYRRLYEAEAALGASEARFRTLVEEAGDGFAVLDGEGRYLDVNSTWCRQLGYAREELLRLSIADIDLLFSPQRFAVDFQSLVGKPPVTYESAHRRKDRTTFPVEVTLSIVRIGGVSQALALARDITERKRAVEALQESERNLRSLLKSMINAFSLFESVFDDNGDFISYRFVFINDSYERMAGVKNEEVKGKTVHAVWPETEPEWVRRYGEVAVTGVSQTFDLYHGPTRKLYRCSVYRPWDTKDRFCVVSEDITERREAEEALRDSEVHHRTILATALDGFWLADMQGRLLEVNEAYCRMTGYSRQELLAMSIPDLEATETRAETAARVERIGTHGADRFESRHRRKDGSIIEVDISVQFQPMEGGRMVVFVRDITERKRAQEALRESEERHRSIIEQLNDVYYRTDRNGCITMMSPSAAHLFGFPSTGEMIGRPIESLWHYPGQRAALLAAIAERGFVQDYEATAVRTDGRPFAVAVSSHYVRDASGAVDGVEGIIRDITERKLVEEALQRSEERYRLLFETESDAIFLVDRDTGRFIAANPSAERMYGYGRDEFLRLTASDVSAEPEKTRQAIAAADGHVPVRLHRRKDGTVFPVEISGSYFDDRGRRVYVAAIRDITERRQAEEWKRLERERIRTILMLSQMGDDSLERIMRLIAEHSARQTLSEMGFCDIFESGEETVSAQLSGAGSMEACAVNKGPFSGEVLTLLLRDGGLWAEAIRRGEPIVVNDYSGPVPGKRGTPPSHVPLRRLLAVPIVDRGRPIGVIGVANKAAEYSDEDVLHLRSLAEETGRVLRGRQDHEALRESELKLKEAQRLGRIGHWEFDVDTQEIRWSEAVYEIYERDPALGAPSAVEEAAYYSPEDAQRLRAAAAATIETGEAFEVEVPIRLAGGKLKHVIAVGTRITDSHGSVIRLLGTVQDVTRRRQAEEMLRALARHLDSVREEEHTRIARQIHDELGQALTALRLDLTWIGRKIAKGNTALRRRIDAAVALTDETITVGQRIVGELRPPILDDLGLVPAVEWFAQHFAKRSGLRIELDLGAEEPVVPVHLAAPVYRIVQEALANVARHARATHARVRIGEQDGALTIDIRDDGQGFPEEAIRSPRSFGIIGMRERAASQGGELVITSSPGAGTTVRVTFPLERREEPRVPR